MLEFDRATYTDTFAPRDGDPEYPDAWRGCMGAWRPSLGPTGATLFDWSGQRNDGTVAGTLSSYWVQDQGYALSNNGTVGPKVTISDNPGLRPGSSDFSVSFWFKTSASQGGTILSKRLASGTFNQFQIGIGNIDSGGSYNSGSTLFFFAFDTGGGNQGAHTSNTFTDGIWHHGAIISPAGSTQPTIYVDRLLQSLIAGGSASRPNINNTSAMVIGEEGDGAHAFNGLIDDILYFPSRQLTYGMIQTLGLRRGIAYEAAGTNRKPKAAAAAASKLFRVPDLTGLGSGGPFFKDPLAA